MLIKADLSGGPGSLRELIGAGEPLNPEVIAQVRQQWGMTLRDGYGQTEMTARSATRPGAPVKPGSMGRPLPGVPVVLVDPATGEVAAGRGRDLPGPRRRAGPPAAADDRLPGRPERDDEATAGGFYHTGDLVARDEDGYITYVGRTDDVFKASDYKISPFELESVLIEHPAVAEAAVVPAPDPVRLAVPKAYVVARARPRADPRDGAGDPRVRPRPPAALPAGPAARVRRAAEDDLRQDPPGRAAPARGRRRAGRRVRVRGVPVRGLRGAPHPLSPDPSEAGHAPATLVRVT